MVEEPKLRGGTMKSHALLVFAVLLSAITCGATFLFALYRQLAMVEVAASIVTGVQLYLLSSSIGDWIEKKPQANARRMLVAVTLACAVVLSFFIARSMV
jgi:uncharacterized membrane protein YjjP (DUF1212 family)